MNPTQIGKLVEEVGVPMVAAGAAAFAAWYLLKYMTGNLGNQMSEIKQEIKDETDEVQAEVKLLHNITIKLVDRIRVMERNQMAAHVQMLTKLNCEIPVWDTTRAERHAEAEELVKDIGVRNGEMG
jgi:hypothetical protein|tara:strand:- start:1808 stop:2185 length:378 start_codon:yes stop_codon:yes gene_type:complete